jgi:hypothetical protein
LIRAVFAIRPGLFGLVPLEDTEIVPTMRVEGTTYYRAETHDHWVLYKPALSGWGAAAPNPGDARPVFDPRQR